MELPIGSLIIIAFLVAMVILTGLWKVLRRQKRHNAPNTLRNARENSGGQAQATPANDVPATSSCVQVNEISILDEVEIYLSYGHLEQAATSLRWYVDHNPDNIQQMRRLLSIYREISDIDHFAELLEKLNDSGAIPGAEAQDLVLEGLKLDPQNLQLRVTAENLGVNSAQIAAVVTHALHAPQSAISSSLAGAQRALQQAIVNPEPLDLLSGFAVKPGQSSSGDSKNGSADAGVVLLTGSEDLTPLDEEEYEVVAGLISPLSAARHLLTCRQYSEAERLLRRNLILDPRKLILQVTLLEMLYIQRRCAAYAESLLQLYITLWGAGSALRTRLLHHGQRLGKHDLWTSLAESDGEENILAELAEQYGLYLPITAIPPSSPPLVTEEFRRDHQITPKDSEDSVIEECNLLLEYGQVDEAVDLLEKATLAQPEHSIYYGPLLEMYERMDARERFSQFIQSILTMDTQPNEDIMRQMFSLAERLQRHPQRQII
jgi:tetratricopeptide (TPR) repeat protein